MKSFHFGAPAVLGVVLILVGVTSAKAAMKSVGGIGAEKPSDPAVKDVVSAVGPQIKTAAAAKLTSSEGTPAAEDFFKNEEIEVVSYKTQVVAGTNYFVKFRMGGMVFHARIFRSFNGTKELSKVVGPKQETDPIEYF